VSEDGVHSNSTSTNITVTNVSPTPTISGPLTGVPGQTLTYTGTFTDPGTVGANGEAYTYLWKVTDSSSHTVSSITTPGPFSFIITSTGTYTVSYKVTDDSGGSGTVTKTLTIKSVDVQTDPQDPTKTALVVGGTTGDDTITISPSPGNAGKYTVVVNGSTIGTTYKPTGHIIVYGGAGNDTITLARNGSNFVTIPAFLFGGDGDNTLDASGSTANNVLVGGSGNDALHDGSGFNILIGGDGSDNLNQNAGGSGQSNLGTDILIKGRTSYDSNVAALIALMAEWGRTDETTAQKIDHLDGTTSGGSNGSDLLVTSGINQSVFEDVLATDHVFSDDALRDANHKNWLVD
jgi:hypothetical protein